ncbi:MAG: hypothetical protein NVSMB54_17430 [Ktedonobacteraceae bacterium]
MADFAAQSENNTVNTSSVMIETRQDNGIQPTHNKEKKTPSSPIIWTPRFIILFFLTIVIGLSVESLLTQGWLNKAYKAEWILLVHVLLILTGLIVLSIKARSMWLRTGGIFGCIWAVFTGASYVATLLGINGRSIIALQFQAAIACALLATYICFSTHRIAFRRWDSIFFWLVPLVGGSAVAALYALARTDPHHTRVLVNATITVLFSLCIAIWWLRLSCWRSQPCITFLLGIAPLLLLLLPLLHADTIGTQFFFSQVLLLCILLGVMRMLQGEIHHSS